MFILVSLKSGCKCRTFFLIEQHRKQIFCRKFITFHDGRKTTFAPSFSADPFLQTLSAIP